MKTKFIYKRYLTRRTWNPHVRSEKRLVSKLITVFYHQETPSLRDVSFILKLIMFSQLTFIVLWECGVWKVEIV